MVSVPKLNKTSFIPARMKPDLFTNCHRYRVNNTYLL
jgi:hypothetical protein